ncbi:MAG: undecaprenyldiphospho-muramoylpentapeptide beta-N-acetylglucosaminyltransferase [candidate division Zixibacteria bacterium]|nr:undecaprenyldiphospho-muramoylpentapeptide beta-N-acetylglucosaminyltransferase [candidate division Zixibacteria bacterium]
MADIIFAAGGTGGHIFPALAIANRLTKEAPNVSISFLGRRNSMEEKLVTKNGYNIEFIPAVKMSRSLGGVIRFALSYPLTVLHSIRMLGRLQPKAIVATGGYVSGPIGTAAFIKRIPLILQEQNSVPGLSSKLLNLFAKITFTSFPDAVRHFIRKNSVQLAGNPVRDGIGELGRIESCATLDIDVEKIIILIIGGSQGAKSINEAMSSLIINHVTGKGKVHLIWQCGQKETDAISKLCEDAGISAIVRPFFDRMDAVLGAADISICRGGASTLTELSKAGIPMLIVPYPYATANHQEANADYYQKLGAGIMVQDNNDLAENLHKALENLLDSEDVRHQIANASKRAGAIDSTGIITNKILEELRK